MIHSRIWRALVLGVFAALALYRAIGWWRGFGDPASSGTVRNRRIVEAMLEAKRCASCSFPIADAPVHDDGCAVCPECGSAWRLARGSNSSSTG